MNKQCQYRLQNMVESRFVLMHSRPDSTGDASGAMRTRRLWHEYICSLGMHLTGWPPSGSGIYLRDPGTLMEASWGLAADTTYIVVPEDLALKILALGDLP